MEQIVEQLAEINRTLGKNNEISQRILAVMERPEIHFLRF